MARKHFLAAGLISCAVLPGALHADGPLPGDPVIVMGDITISRPADLQLLLQQSGAAGIIDWGSFSIGDGYGVSFQNGTGATLNRVTGGDLSQVMGSLDATGSVFLINQNGIIIGKTGAVNTGGRFVASALDIGNEDFLDGGDNVFAGGSPAYVINLGQISSLGGDVSLMARNVVNQGRIAAPGGTVGLAAGREILMRDAAVADGMFAVRIGGSDTSVTESGAIRAAAAELRANGGNVYALAGNTQGTIAATGVAKVKGRVFLTAGDAGKVKVEKAVKATNAAGTGGAITISGGTVDLAGRLDVSGSAGGTVIVTSAVQTNFSGEILAFGEGASGSGGFAEVSGRHLSFGGTVVTGGGTLLIDPDNIEITNGRALLAGASVLTPGSIVALLRTQDVIIQTSGTDGEAGVILVTNAIRYSSGNSLTLLAHGDILAFAAITNGSAAGGDINLVSGWDGSTSTTAFDSVPFDAADLATQTLFGQVNGTTFIYNGANYRTSGSVFIGDGGQFPGVDVGSRNGATRVYAGDLVLTGTGNPDSSLGYAQLGYNLASASAGFNVRGAISVRATRNVQLNAGTSQASYAQIGHVGMNRFDGAVSADVNAPIRLEALGNLTLNANGSADNAYAMLGHGSLDFLTGQRAGGTRSGDITAILGGEVTLQDGNGGFPNPAWIGHASADVNAVSGADIALQAAAFDTSVARVVGSGGLGRLDIAMISSALESGNVTVLATDSGLNLVGSTGGASCECNFISTGTDLVVRTANHIQLGVSFFFSNLGGGQVTLSAGENLRNTTGGPGFGTMTGRWLVYSTRPDTKSGDIGVMDAAFIAYGTSFDPADPQPASLPTGNGLVYAVTPVVSVGPSGMTYGGALVPPAITVTVGGVDVAADAFGFDVGPGRVDAAQVSFSGEGFVNAGTYASGLTTDLTDTTAAVVSGITLTAGELTVDRALLTAVIIGNPTKPFDGTTLATLTSGNFDILGFVTGEGAMIGQTTGTYAAPDIGTGNTITAALTPGDFVANGGTLLGNYILPVSASGAGAIDIAPPVVTVEDRFRGIDAFDTSPLGQPTGPAAGLEVISTETTRQIIDEINAGVAFCKQLVRQEYMVDCLSDRLQSVADGLSAVGEYSEVRAALEAAAQKLHALALANSSADLPQTVHRSAGRSSSRPLTAVSDAALASVNGQAAAIIESTKLVLLRSSENSERRRVAFEQISQVVDSTKVLLRSS